MDSDCSVLLFTSYVILGKSLKFTVCQFPHFKNGNTDNTYSTRLTWHMVSSMCIGCYCCCDFDHYYYYCYLHLRSGLEVCLVNRYSDSDHWKRKRPHYVDGCHVRPFFCKCPQFALEFLQLISVNIIVNIIT